MTKQNYTIPMLSEKTINYFWSKVAKWWPRACWLWQGKTFKKGYGYLVINRKGIRAHRLAIFLATGIDPDDLLVCHTCDTPGCCNPAHLFLGTSLDNSVDMVAKGRQAKGDRQGARLHPETRPRGDSHYSRTSPEKVARGDRHHSRLRPERMARGDKSGSSLHPESYQGTRNSNARITDDIVRIIRNRYSTEGITLKTLGELYGITESTVWKIVKLKAWKHVA